jgi:hypothetical protein
MQILETGPDYMGPAGDEGFDEWCFLHEECVSSATTRHYLDQCGDTTSSVGGWAGRHADEPDGSDDDMLHDTLHGLALDAEHDYERADDAYTADAHDDDDAPSADDYDDDESATA